MLDLAAGTNSDASNYTPLDPSDEVISPITPTLNGDTSTLTFDDKLANLLQSEYPRKSKYLDSNDWHATEVPKYCNKYLHKSVQSILLLLRTLSNNSTQTATDVMNILLHSHEMLQNNEIFKGIENEIALSMREYFTTLTKSSKTRKSKKLQDKIDLIMHAATNNPSSDRHEVCKYFDFNNVHCYKNIVVKSR